MPDREAVMARHRLLLQLRNVQLGPLQVGQMVRKQARSIDCFALSASNASSNPSCKGLRFREARAGSHVLLQSITTVLAYFLV